MTNNKQQTAVQEFWGKISLKLSFEQIDEFVPLFYQAKEMEKEMTIKLYADYENYLEEAFKNQCGGQAVILSFQEFYEQRYGGSEQ
jgi:hypothetical protein